MTPAALLMQERRNEAGASVLLGEEILDIRYAGLYLDEEQRSPSWAMWR